MCDCLIEESGHWWGVSCVEEQTGNEDPLLMGLLQVFLHRGLVTVVVGYVTTKVGEGGDTFERDPMDSGGMGTLPCGQWQLHSAAGRHAPPCGTALNQCVFH